MQQSVSSCQDKGNNDDDGMMMRTFRKKIKMKCTYDKGLWSACTKGTYANEIVLRIYAVGCSGYENDEGRLAIPTAFVCRYFHRKFCPSVQY